jgi:hypothetical protein
MKEPGKELQFFGQFSNFFIFLKIAVTYQNHFFEYFENWWVSEYISSLITGETIYHSL